MSCLGRHFAAAGRSGLAVPPGRWSASELIVSHRRPSAYSTSAGVASTSDIGYPNPDDPVHEPRHYWRAKPLTSSESSNRVPTMETGARRPRPSPPVEQRRPARGDAITAKSRRQRPVPSKVLWPVLPKDNKGVPFTNAQVLAALRQDRAAAGIDILTSNDGDSPPTFNPSDPTSLAALRRLARCAFSSRLERNPVPQDKLRTLVGYVLRKDLRDPWVLLYSIAIASCQLDDSALQAALEAVVRDARDGWPKADVERSFETGSRLKQTMQAELDIFRTQLPLDIQLSWDPILRHDNALAHCIRLIEYLRSSSLARASATDILAYVNPTRQSDMDEHPFAVIFLLETLRQAKTRDTADGEAAAIFDGTVALLPELTESWRQFRGVAFDLRSVKPHNLARAEKHIETVYASAELYFMGALGKELGQTKLEPWRKGGFLLADEESTATTGSPDAAVVEASPGGDR